MEREPQSIAIAVGLMRKAQALLEDQGVKDGAARLQQAIEVTLASCPIPPGQELKADMACLVAGIALDGAQTSDAARRR